MLQRSAVIFECTDLNLGEVQVHWSQFVRLRMAERRVTRVSLYFDAPLTPKVGFARPMPAWGFFPPMKLDSHVAATGHDGPNVLPPSQAHEAQGFQSLPRVVGSIVTVDC